MQNGRAEPAPKRSRLNVQTSRDLFYSGRASRDPVGCFGVLLGLGLKPGGRYLSLTSNRYHFVTIVSSPTAPRFHTWLYQHRGWAERDTCPTADRLNTCRVKILCTLREPSAIGRLCNHC